MWNIRKHKKMYKNGKKTVEFYDIQLLKMLQNIDHHMGPE